MVEKSKPPAAAEKQETLPKRAGTQLASLLFYDEGCYPIIVGITVLLFSLFAEIVICYVCATSYCVFLLIFYEFYSQALCLFH